MSVMAMFLAVLAAIVVWWLFIQRLTVKPWIEKGAAVIDGASEGSTPPGKVGLWFFLAVVTSFFALFASAYALRMTLDDWSPVPEPQLLWVNTGVLIVASFALQWARYAARKEDWGKVRAGLLLGGLLTMAFLCGQWLAWQELNNAGYGVRNNPANSFFYLITGLHGLHLLGGLWVWGLTVLKLQRCISVKKEQPIMDKLRLRVELCSVYWHYLLVVWIALFGLLLIT